ncbi:hypothetical protein TNIN_91831, partial [Trichonephila inaurata madagascariensis]
MSHASPTPSGLVVRVKAPKYLRAQVLESEYLTRQKGVKADTFLLVSFHAKLGDPMRGLKDGAVARKPGSISDI